MSQPGSIPAVMPPAPALAPAGATALAATHEGAGAAVEFGVSWSSTSARHEDRYVARRLDLGRDILPAALAVLAHQPVGQETRAAAPPGHDPAPAMDPGLILRLPVDAFDPARPHLRGLVPRVGRFYPRGFLAGHAGIHPRDPRPFRVVATGDSLEVDLNHPLAGHGLTIEARILEAWETVDGPAERPLEVAGQILDGGPGMEARYGDRPTDFWSDAPFRREDEAADEAFYARPRLVNHLDTTAIAQVMGLYRRLLPRNARVLDLMTSWTSHLPEALEPAAVTGLGMNRAELEANPVLTARHVHDLNHDPRLPFADGAFDAMVCTVSVEYLTRPLEVFAEAARVLRPGGRFVVTFSNRWFPPKVVALWEALHEFERPGLVLEYFLAGQGFEALNTWSVRGLPRPADDKYAGRLALSDPIYAVWGERAA